MTFSNDGSSCCQWHNMLFHVLFFIACKLTGFVTCVLLFETGLQMEFVKKKTVLRCAVLEMSVYHVGRLCFSIYLYLHLQFHSAFHTVWGCVIIIRGNGWFIQHRSVDCGTSGCFTRISEVSSSSCGDTSGIIQSKYDSPLRVLPSCSPISTLLCRTYPPHLWFAFSEAYLCQKNVAVAIYWRIAP